MVQALKASPRDKLLVWSYIDRRGDNDRADGGFEMSKRMIEPQDRRREMFEIISRVTEWAGGKEQAMIWYRTQPLPAFGDRTAEALVKEGEAAAIREYLDHMAVGGFA
jgi:hypothetical protein